MIEAIIQAATPANLHEGDGGGVYVLQDGQFLALPAAVIHMHYCRVQLRATHTHTHGGKDIIMSKSTLLICLNTHTVCIDQNQNRCFCIAMHLHKPQAFIAHECEYSSPGHGRNGGSARKHPNTAVGHVAQPKHVDHVYTSEHTHHRDTEVTSATVNGRQGSPKLTTSNILRDLSSAVVQSS